jgi:hypothetical protein
MDGACSTHGEKVNLYSIVVGKPEGKKPLNIKIGLREIGCGDTDWIDLA